MKKQFDLVKLASSAPKLQTEVEFKDGMFLTVNHLPRPALQKIYKESQTMRLNYKTQIRESTLNNDTFSTKFVDEVVIGWRGFTPAKINSLIAIELSGFSDEEKNQEIPYDSGQMAFLVKNAYDLDSFLQGYVQDLANFEPERDYETKNSVASQSGS